MINQQKLNFLGNLLVGKIRENTLQGKDKDGRTFKPYSIRPFKMPISAVPNFSKFETILKSEQKKSNPNIKIYKSKKGYKEGVFLGGYKQFKSIFYTSGDVVNLFNTGAMVRDLTLIETTTEDNLEITTHLSAGEQEITIKTDFPKRITFKIGFTAAEQIQKYRQNVKRGRDMLGLPQEIVKEIITKNL